MDISKLNWAFLLEYNKDNTSLTLQFSPWFIDQHQLLFEELTFDEKDIIQIIHRYDYRKLDYFVNVKMDQVFDTLMRFNLTKGKFPFRTLAVCHLNENGLSCVNFEEEPLLQLKKQFRQQHKSRLNYKVAIENKDDMHMNDHVLTAGIYKHLAHMTYRDLNIL